MYDSHMKSSIIDEILLLHRPRKDLAWDYPGVQVQGQCLMLLLTCYV